MIFFVVEFFLYCEFFEFLFYVFCFGENCVVMDIDILGMFMMCYVVVNYLKKGGKGKGLIEGGVIISISVILYYIVNWY